MQNALDPVNKSVQDAADQISDLVERAPDLKFQINGRASSWLLTTFLDDVSFSMIEIKRNLLSAVKGCRRRYRVTECCRLFIELLQQTYSA